MAQRKSAKEQTQNEKVPGSLPGPAKLKIGEISSKTTFPFAFRCVLTDGFTPV